MNPLEIIGVLIVLSIAFSGVGHVCCDNGREECGSEETMTHPPFNVPVPCPVCNGTGIYYDTDFRGRVRENGCIACHGSCVMYLTEQQYAKRIGDADGYTTSRTYTTQEIKIITKAKTARVAFRLINEAGYTDRCFHQVRKYRDRLAAKRKKRLHTDKTTIDITQSKTDIRNTEPKEDPK